jgi:pyruvate/2-oxoglutarate dehydrogenase complex dihydrolipoamide acyltransferase (E2) component
MPDVAADSDERVLAAWLVEEEAAFDAAQTIAYVETEDELFSVEAGRPGVLLKTLVEPGSRVQPGTPIGILGDPHEEVADLDRVLAELGLVQRERVAAGSMAGPSQPPFALPSSVEPVETTARPASVELPSVEPVETTARPPSLVDDDDEEQVVQHHYLRARVRVDRLVALSARLERDRPDSSVLDLVARAIVAAHRQVPQLGVARLEHDKGAAAGIPVSYPGRFGVEEAAAMVPTGQAAALAVGSVRDEPVIDAGAVVPGKVLTLTLSVRPGSIDDVQASRWLAVLVALLERPEWLVE